jgi:hypothetical protein
VLLVALGGRCAVLLGLLPTFEGCCLQLADRVVAGLGLLVGLAQLRFHGDLRVVLDGHLMPQREIGQQGHGEHDQERDRDGA